MERFKKQNLKISHQRISRDLRHAEMLKARESSRFKRLSMIRSMDEVSCNNSVDDIDEEKENMPRETVNVQKSSKTPVKSSRLEMLQKWKQEKILIKEMELKRKKKPFYAGSKENKLPNFQLKDSNLKGHQSFKSSFINLSKNSFNVSRTASSRVQSKPPSFQPIKAPSKLVAPSTFQISKIPNNTKPITSVAKPGYSTNKAANTTIVGKKPTIAVMKTATVMSNTPTFGKKPSSAATKPSITASKTPTFGKAASSVLAKPGIAATNKIGSSSRSVIGGIKPPVSKLPQNMNLKYSRQNESCTSKVTSQGSFQKPAFIRPPSKPALKGLQSTENITIRKKLSNKKPPAVVKQEQSANNKNEMVNEKGSSNFLVCETPVKKELNYPFLLETPDFHQIKQVIDAKIQAMNSEQEIQDEGVPSSGVDEPLINEDKKNDSVINDEKNVSIIKEDKIILSKPSSREDAVEEIRTDFSKVTIAEKSLSIQQDEHEAKEDKVSFSSPTSATPNKSQVMPDLNQSKQICETELQFTDEAQEKQKEASIMKSPEENLVEKLDTIYDDEEVLSEQNLESIPDLTLNCDVSVIRHAREASFAPSDFKFQPPDGLSVFSFEVAGKRSLKFMTRTSTPSRKCEKTSDRLSNNNKSTNNKDWCSLINGDDFIQKTGIDLSGEIVVPYEDLLTSESSDILVNDEAFEEEEPEVKDVENQIQNYPLKDTDLEQELLIKPEIREVNEGKTLEYSADEMVSSYLAKESLPEFPKINQIKEDIEVREVNEGKMLSEHSADEMVSGYLAKESLPESPNINQIKEDIEAKMQSIKLEQDKEDSGKETSKWRGKKSTEVLPKRISIRKKSVLHSIAETHETELSLNSSVKSQNSPFTSRRSSRLLALKSETIGESSKSTTEEEPVLLSTISPMRRSQRVLKPISDNHQFEEDVLSPFKGKKSGLTSRRSVKLIDFSSDDNGISNTPGKSGPLKSNITADFEKLSLSIDENIDHSLCLIDFENSPNSVLAAKSRKVSLLYSPEKRKSIRKSIRGDLICFSPNNN